MVQEWLDGPTSSTGSNPAGYANDGLIVKDVTEGATSNELSFDSQYASSDQPYLQVSWEPRGQGDQPQFTYLSTQITDKANLKVNVASGDMMLTNTDLSVAGTGLSYSETRVWNSLNPEYMGFGQWGESGSNPLYVEPDGSVYFADNSDAFYPFIKQANGTFITPPGIKAVMCVAGGPAPCPATMPSGVTYELIYTQSLTTLEFDSYGDPVRNVDHYGNTQTMGYTGPPGDFNYVTDSQGRQFNYSWETDSTGWQISGIQDAAGGRSTSYGYTFAHGYDELTSYKDANGNTTTYGYEPYGYLSLITTPAGNEIKTQDDAQGRIEYLTRVTNISAGTGPTTDFTYYNFGAATSLGCAANQKATVVTDPDGVDGVAGHTTTYCANVDDEVQKTIDANGNATTGTFDALGNGTSTTAAARGTGLSAGVSSLVYDSTGQNVNCSVSGSTSQQTTCPSGAMASGYSTQYAYGSAAQPHQPSQLTDPQRNSTSLCYDGDTCAGTGTPAGALKQITDPLSSQNTLSYTYNSNGTVASSTDADGHVTTYGYDSVGNLTSITPPTSSGLSAQTITNDADSRPHTVTQCVTGSPCTASETATITYDNLDRITKVVYTGPAASMTVQYVYDKDGNLYQRIDPQGTTTYTVDALDRITNESDPGSVSYSYAYDDASNLTCFTDGGGHTTYAYNALDQMSDMYELDLSCGAKSSTTHDTFAYDNDGSLTKITYPSGVNINYGLDPTTGRILSITTKNSAGSTLRSDTYSFTSGSNDTSLIQSDANTVSGATNTTSYVYDQLNRLITATTGGTSANPSYYHYVLDGAGNRTSQTVNPTASTGGTTTYYDYNSGNELLCRMTTNAACSGLSSTELSGYTYDQVGNQTAITAYSDTAGTTFAYNNANQLTTLTPSGSSAQPLKYLGAGQDDLTAIGTTTLQNSQPGLTAQATSGGTSYYARTPDGLLVDERLPGGTDYNPLYDSQGNIVGLVNSSGSLVQTIRYGPYGENANASGSVGYSATNDPYLFRGGYHTTGGNTGLGNIHNGLYHFGARYLDPTTGRWTQPDPLTTAGSFLYANDDPINSSDPSGEITIGDVIGAIKDAGSDLVTDVIDGGREIADLSSRAADVVTGAVDSVARDLFGDTVRQRTALKGLSASSRTASAPLVSFRGS